MRVVRVGATFTIQGRITVSDTMTVSNGQPRLRDECESPLRDILRVLPIGATFLLAATFLRAAAFLQAVAFLLGATFLLEATFLRAAAFLKGSHLYTTSFGSPLFIASRP